VRDRGEGTYTLVWTPSFLRTARRFVRRHPSLRGLLEDVLRQLERDPRSPRLRFHALRGTHAGRHAVSLTYEHRIVFVLVVRRREVVLLDVGTHDEVYG